MLNGRNGRGLFAPAYYSKFKCIADKCRHSCCVDWEICIDEITYEKYKKLESIINTVVECDDGPRFALKENGRCPHLNDSGLCNIILSHGEDMLSDICRYHPRFFNDVGDGRVEVGLGIVCEEACRLILEDADVFSFVKIDEAADAERDDMDFDPLPQRERIFSIIDAFNSLEKVIDELTTEFDIHDPYTPDEWLDRFLSLEILDRRWERDLGLMRGKLFLSNDNIQEEYDKYYKRLLAYFVCRHVSVAVDMNDLRARLAFAILSVEVIISLFAIDGDRTLEGLIDYARRYSAEIEYSEDNTDELVFIFEMSFNKKSRNTHEIRSEKST